MRNFRAMRARQRGAITMISAVLILILLTEMVIYAVQVGVFEQRKSSNEERYKRAFHIADSAVQQAKTFMSENARLVAREEAQVIPIVDADGDITGWRSGWRNEGRWTQCPADPVADHPCSAEPVAAFRANTFFYEVNGDNTLPFTPVVGATANENVTTHALLCMLDINMAADPVVQGCVAPGGEDNPDYFVLTLMARGQADCDNNGANCTAEALVSEKIGSYGPAGGEGGMPAPLTSKNTLPEGASTDIVPNPNGGGVGVPMSVWIDGNQAVVDGWTGSWATCEAHEWYEVDMFPDDFRCPDPSRVCTCDGKKQISYSLPGSTEQFLGIDVVEDPAFPPNLMSYLFPTTNDEDGADYVKSIADDVVTDCSGLGPGSYGLIVVEENCSITGGGLIGTAAAPVFLVLLGADNSFGGGVEIFGTLFQSTAIHANGGISGNGNLTIYGAMMNDGDISKFSGNLKLVYVDEILDRAFEIGEFASVPGGWTDFHPVWQ